MSSDASYLVDAPKPAGKHVCLPELYERIRFEFDIKESSGRLTDAQLLFVINASRDRLFQLLVNIDQSYFRFDTTLTTVAGDELVTLPERFYAPVRLVYVDDENNERDITRNSRRDVRIGPSSETWDERLPTYYLTPTHLVLEPPPSVARPLYLVYVQSWVALVDAPLEPSCWDVQPTWDDWVIYDALVTLSRRSRRMDDVAVFTAARDELTNRYETSQSNENHGGPTFARRLMFTRPDRDGGWEL